MPPHPGPPIESSPAEKFFGLVARPFSLTPDLRFAYHSRSHTHALDEVTSSLRRREGLIVVTGAVGTGKTMLCRSMLENFESRMFLSVILDPGLEVEDLLRKILLDFGIISGIEQSGTGPMSDVTRHQFVSALQQFLSSLIPLHAHAVIMIDEAQRLNPRVLEEIRLLSNFETDEAKLLQIVLVGQPELDQVLRSPSMQQLNQRVARRCELQPLSETEVGDYIERRLTVAASPEVLAGAPHAESADLLAAGALLAGSCQDRRRRVGRYPAARQHAVRPSARRGVRTADSNCRSRRRARGRRTAPPRCSSGDRQTECATHAADRRRRGRARAARSGRMVVRSASGRADDDQLTTIDQSVDDTRAGSRCGTRACNTSGARRHVDTDADSACDRADDCRASTSGAGISRRWVSESRCRRSARKHGHRKSQPRSSSSRCRPRFVSMPPAAGTGCSRVRSTRATRHKRRRRRCRRAATATRGSRWCRPSRADPFRRIQMSLLMLTVASLAYAVGGLFMKQSNGLTQLAPTAAFLALFAAGASLQALGMRQAEMGVSYVFVLGIEAIAAVGLSAALLHESYSLSRLAAIALIIIGIAWLRRA
ncbi:MAG: SMR family transporter [Vicinamibacterales bacterium]